jgi:hypothetical protein
LSGRNAPPQNPLPCVDRKVLADCIRPQFGVELRSFTESRRGINGTFTGYGPDTGYTGTNPNGPFEYANSNPGSDAEFEVINEVSAFSGKQLGGFAHKYSGGKVPGGWVYGYTGPTPSGYTSYRNFTANDLKDAMQIISTQIHELGNSLHDITTAANNDKKFVTNPTSAPDSDAGAKLEKCVRDHKGLKY